MVVFGTDVLDPFGHADVTIAEGDRPWTGQRVVNAGDLVEHDFGIGLVQSETLLDDRGIVFVKWNAAAIVAVRVFQATGLDHECVVTAISVLIEPFANCLCEDR